MRLCEIATGSTHLPKGGDKATRNEGHSIIIHLVVGRGVAELMRFAGQCSRKATLDCH